MAQGNGSSPTFNVAMVGGVAVYGFAEISVVPQVKVVLKKVALKDGGPHLTKLEHEATVSGSLEGRPPAYDASEIPATLTWVVDRGQQYGAVSYPVTGKLVMKGDDFDFKDAAGKDPVLRVFDHQLFGRGSIKAKVEADIPHAQSGAASTVSAIAFSNHIDLDVFSRSPQSGARYPLGEPVGFAASFAQALSEARDQILKEGAVRLTVWEVDAEGAAPFKLSLNLVNQLQALSDRCEKIGLAPSVVAASGLEVKLVCGNQDEVRKQAKGFSKVELLDDGVLVAVDQADAAIDRNSLWFKVDGDGYITGPAVDGQWSSKLAINQLTRNFSLEEFRKKGAASIKLAPNLVKALQALRDAVASEGFTGLAPAGLSDDGREVTVTCTRKGKTEPAAYAVLEASARALGLFDMPAGQSFVQTNKSGVAIGLSLRVAHHQADLVSGWLKIDGGFITGYGEGGWNNPISRSFRLKDFSARMVAEVHVKNQSEEVQLVWPPQGAAKALAEEKPAPANEPEFRLSPTLALALQVLRLGGGGPRAVEVPRIDVYTLEETGLGATLRSPELARVTALGKDAQEGRLHLLDAGLVTKAEVREGGFYLEVKEKPLGQWTAEQQKLVSGVANGVLSQQVYAVDQGFITGPAKGSWKIRVTRNFALSELSEARHRDAALDDARALRARRDAKFNLLDKGPLLNEYACWWLVGGDRLLDARISSVVQASFASDSRSLAAGETRVFAPGRLLVVRQPESGDYEFAYRLEVCEKYSDDPKVKNQFIEVARLDQFATGAKPRLEAFSLDFKPKAGSLTIWANAKVSGLSPELGIDPSIALWVRDPQRGQNRLFASPEVESTHVGADGMLHKLVYQFPHRTTGKHQEDPLYTTAKALIASKGGPHGGLFATMKIFDDVPMHYFCEYKRPIRGFAPGGSFASDESRRLVASQESDGADFASALVRSVDEYYSRTELPPPEMEVLLVAGTEQFSPTIGNKMKFTAQVVREIREHYPTHPYVTVLLFEQGYNAEEIKVFQEAVKAHNSRAVVKIIQTVDEVIRYINTRTTEPGGKLRTVPDDDDRTFLISTLQVYAHGLPSRFVFGLQRDHTCPPDQELTVQHVEQLEPGAFAPKAKLVSYACRTGIVADNKVFDPFGDWATVAGVKNSLAQKLADRLPVSVYAYLIRSEYKPTWKLHGAPGDSDFEATEQRLPDPTVDVGVALWHPLGAKAPVEAGKTPPGLPRKMYRFEKNQQPVEADFPP